MTPLFAAFQDELTKTAKLRAIGQFAKRLKESKDLRRAIGSSAILGAGTGAVTGALSDSDKSLAKRVAGGAGLGLVGGAITGGAFPGWFGSHSRFGADELARMGRRI